jgi:endoglucanase
MTHPVSTRRRAALAALTGGVLLLRGAPSGAVAGAMADGLPRLGRGFNLSHWFEYERSQGLTAAELVHLRSMGLDHVRIPLDPLVCGWQWQLPQQLPFLKALRQAMQDAVAAGLAVVLDLHLEPEAKALLEARPELETAVVDLWQSLAAGLADLPVQQLAFELLNEPQYYGLKSWRWPLLRRRLLAAVRRVAPKNLVLLSGNRGASLGALLELVPEPDDAVAAVFHYYEPFLFTHQGVAWLDPKDTVAGLLTGVLYPASAQHNKQPTVSKPSGRVTKAWTRHLAEAWDGQRLTRDFERAQAWSRKTGVPVVCNEFGVIRNQVDAASRYRWLRDMRLALESQNIGWTVWDYTDIFGLTVESSQPERAGLRSLEPEARLALGLGQRLARGTAPPARASGVA